MTKNKTIAEMLYSELIARAPFYDVTLEGDPWDYLANNHKSFYISVVMALENAGFIELGPNA